MVHCPNCSAPASSEPISCPLCGYRGEAAAEYFWVYLGGSAFILLGFGLGAIGVAIEGAGAGHWIHEYRGWFPLVPWPESYHWLSVLVAGIALTLGGMGITRRRRSAWLFLTALMAYETCLTLLAAQGLLAARAPAGKALMLFFAAVILSILLLRIGLALWRTPPRDAAKLQELVRSEAEKAGKQGVA